MRLAPISLAAKYRVLFGTAVLLIIGAALYWPWYQMEALVLQQPFLEARRLADDYFRLVMPETARPPGGNPHAGQSVLPGSRDAHAIRFIRFNARPDDPDSVLNQQESHPLVQKAFRAFLNRPTRDFWQVSRDEQEGRTFFYAQPVRAAKRCLTCHGENKSATPYQENQLAGIIAVTLPADTTEQQVVIYRWTIVGCAALAGILAILVFYVITHRFILSPIQELREVAQRVSEGDLAVRSTLRTGDEFEQLSGSLNTMLERLRASQEELKRANRALDEKLEQMAETNVALFEANRVKSEFLASVSHELRTPLTNIIGFAELLREGPAQDPEGKAARYAENILISGRILLEIINDLLDLARIEAGKIELRLEPVDLTELCERLVDFMRPAADKKPLDLGFEASGPLPALTTDRGRLRQILFNLLSNAIKFTPAGGRVRLRAGPVDDGVLLEVIDTGPGIAPENRRLIFEKFRQIDQSATREHHGVGLGLAIARELTHLLGGQIDVDSQPGHGARFWVRLPLGAPSTPVERELVSLV